MLFIGTWLFCYIIFPAWYLPVSRQGRFWIFTLFLVYFSFNGWLLYRRTGSELEESSSCLRLKDLRNILKSNLTLVLILLLCIILHLYPMTLPITSVGDEHYHSYVSVPIINFIEKKTSLPLPLLAWLVSLAGILIYVSGRRKTGNKFIMLVIGLLFGYLYFYSLNRSGLPEQLGPAKHLFRFPPVGKTVNFIFYSLFGVSEFTSRLPQLFFSILTGIYLYRLVRMRRNKETAILATSILLFLPVFFYFGSLAYLACGVIFFTISSSFYFLRHLKTGRISDLILSGYLVGLGFLYDRVLLIMVFIFGGHLLLYEMRSWQRETGQKLRLYAGAGWLTLVPILPWLIIGYKYSSRNYYPVFFHWTSWPIATSVLRQIPQAAGCPVFIISLIGLVYSLWKKRDGLTAFLLIWFFVYYFFITSDAFYFATRLNLPLYPAVAIMAGQFLGDIFCGWRKKVVFMAGYFVLLGYLVISSTLVNFPPLRPEYTVLTNKRVGYLPYDQVLRYIKNSLPENSRILATMGCEPSHFYLSLYKMEDKYVWYRKNWVESKEEQNIDNLYEFCHEHDFSYIVFPRGHWLEPWVKVELVEKIAREEDARFELIRKFRFGENEIILAGVR